MGEPIKMHQFEGIHQCSPASRFITEEQQDVQLGVV